MSQTTPPHQVRQGQPGERLDTLLRTTSPHGWWALAFIAAFVGAWLAWACIATIPQQVSFTATVNAAVYTRLISAPAAGEVQGDAAEIGREVTSGQPLGQIVTPEGKTVEVRASADGKVSNVQVQQGQWVDIGAEMGRILVQPDLAKGISFVTYLPLSTIARTPMGSDVTVTVSDPITGYSYSALGTITAIGEVPASTDTMYSSSQSTALTDQWVADSGGTPYALEINVVGWDEQAAGFEPAGGQVATVVRTYAESRPISIIFGGN